MESSAKQCKAVQSNAKQCKAMQCKAKREQTKSKTKQKQISSPCMQPLCAANVCSYCISHGMLTLYAVIGAVIVYNHSKQSLYLNRLCSHRKLTGAIWVCAASYLIWYPRGPRIANHSQECQRRSPRKGHHPAQGPTPSPKAQMGNCPGLILIPATASILMGTIFDNNLMDTLSDKTLMDIISDEIRIGNLPRYRNVWR